MPHWLFPSMYPTWQRDDDGRLVLLRIPKDLNLRPPHPQYNAHTGSPKDLTRPRWLAAPNGPAHTVGQLDELHLFASRPPATLLVLPIEIQYMILEYLPPVDRVCLGLSCKTLCTFVVSAPRLTPQSWIRFLPRSPWLSVNDLYALASSYYACQMPESYTLLQRLAHGWIPKKDLRYCWKCHQILPRDPSYWRRRISGHKKPKWDIRTGCGKDEWNRKNTAKRFQHLIDMWCKAPFEDSSILSCDCCREALYANNNDTATTPKSKSKSRPTLTPMPTPTPTISHKQPYESTTELQSIHIDRLDGPTRPEPSYNAATLAQNRLIPTPSNIDRMSDPDPPKQPKATPKPAQPRYTIECPACLERQLTFTFRLQRRATFRNSLRDGWNATWKYIWKAVWLNISIVIFLLGMIYHLGLFMGSGLARMYRCMKTCILASTKF